MIRVVLAEDHHLVREALATLLAEQPDIQVVGQVAEGATLFNVVDQLRPDILVMDIQMPDHKPLETTKQLCRHHPSTSVLILSAHNLPEFTVALLQAGASGYVLKDDIPAMFIQALRAVARGEEWVSPQVAKILVEKIRNNSQSAFVELTSRELEILSLMVQGLTNEAIANELSLVIGTVKNHIYSIFRKLDVETRVEAILFAINSGLASIEPDND